MNETYTFSRALHLMRYGGKKMNPIENCEPNKSIEFRVKNGELQHRWIIGNDLDNTWFKTDSISAGRIMGSWVEVKDEK